MVYDDAAVDEEGELKNVIDRGRENKDSSLVNVVDVVDVVDVLGNVAGRGKDGGGSWGISSSCSRRMATT